MDDVSERADQAARQCGPDIAESRSGWYRRVAWYGSAALLACAVILNFLNFNLNEHGFTYMLDFGDALGLPRLAEVDANPTYIHRDSTGYDAQMYAQLALRPSASDPELRRVIDNPPYRARRAFLGWIAWLVGGGDPWRILNVYACLNLIAWMGLAWLLMRWFRPEHGADSFIRWSGVLMSCGMLSSLRHALTDGPALLAIAGAVALVESGRRRLSVVFGTVACLTRETSVLLAAAAMPACWRDSRGWVRSVAETALMSLPLFLWLLHLRSLAPTATYEGGGLANFTWPFAGYFERWRELVIALQEHGWHRAVRYSLLAHVSITVNLLFILLRPRWRDRWWRVGFAYVLMLALLNTQVWEGIPGAACRVLLPLLLAFNILAPRGWRVLPLLISGNLSIFAGMLEMAPPPQPIWNVQRDVIFGSLGRQRPEITVDMVEGFLRAEGRGSNSWQWTTGDATVFLTNPGTKAERGFLRMEVRSPDARPVAVRVGGAEIWAGTVTVRHQSVVTRRFELPPGETRVQINLGPPSEVDSRSLSKRGLRIFVFDLIVD